MVRLDSVLYSAALLGLAASERLSPWDSPHDRVLRAATKRNDLFRRDMRIRKKFGAELSYVESESFSQSLYYIPH